MKYRICVRPSSYIMGGENIQGGRIHWVPSKHKRFQALPCLRDTLCRGINTLTHPVVYSETNG